MRRRLRQFALLSGAVLATAGSIHGGPPFPWRPQSMGPAPYSQRQAVRPRSGNTTPLVSPQLPLEAPPPASAPLPQRIQTQRAGTVFSPGAGIHITASERFLEELIRVESQDEGPVRDCILGAEVVGSQSTDTVVHINLLPDPQMARFDMILQGTTHNNTENRTPQAVIHSEGNHRFDIAKTVQFDGQKLMTRSPSAWLYPCQRNRAAFTPASAVPILGPLVSQYALGMAEQRRPEAEQIAAQKITQQVAPRFDRSIDQRLSSLNVALRETLPRQLPKFGIEHPTTRTRTTENELLVSLAWDSVQSVPEYQPPVLTPDDPQLYLAVHADAVNAWLNRLPLAGREIAISDLARWQAELQQLLAAAPTRPAIISAKARTRKVPTSIVSEPTLLPGLGEPTVIGPILPPPRLPIQSEETQKVPTPVDPPTIDQLDPTPVPGGEEPLLSNTRMILARSNPISVEFHHNEAVIVIVAAFQVSAAPATEEHRLRIPLTSRIEDNALVVTPGQIEVDNAVGSSGAFSSVVREAIEKQVRERIQPTRWALERKFDRDQGAPVTLRLNTMTSEQGWLSLGWGVQSGTPK